jgi:hypothetical protein
MARGKATSPVAQRNHPSAKAEGKHWLDYAIFAFVILTAIGTSFAAFYTRQQWITADDAELRSLRAYGSVYFSPIESFDIADPKGPFPAINVTAQNGGQTPAYNVSVKASIGPLEFPLRRKITNVPLKSPSLTNSAFLFKERTVIVLSGMDRILTDAEKDSIPPESVVCMCLGSLLIQMYSRFPGMYISVLCTLVG